MKKLTPKEAYRQFVALSRQSDALYVKMERIKKSTMDCEWSALDCFSLRNDIGQRTYWRVWNTYPKVDKEKKAIVHVVRAVRITKSGQVRSRPRYIYDMSGAESFSIKADKA